MSRATQYYAYFQAEREVYDAHRSCRVKMYVNANFV